MPQLASLVLTDRAATPVNHTFVPRDVVGNVGTVEEDAATLAGKPRFSISRRQTNGDKGTTGRYKVQASLAVPVVATQTINGVSTPVVVRTGYADVTITFDGSSTEQERKDLIGMLQSSFDSSKWTNDVYVKVQGVY